ncbi:23S rRNA pseudouridine(2604) synthase RluF [Clostridium oryzae]|uniref:Pseudouridine synthase n=1 Tax=Clostridium oryzae TaxID=1450648 RepID=A0A1V4IEA7_9CLOT|nr:23S rRNA pseudouridine(2604) synthase RluF [Clostridium oryzae]OPJ57877.1 ribosomal large subunit pseudouridine synthase F [Clostridium oryzae]
MRKETIIKHSDRKDEIRLNKYLSECGFCSRREADKLIELGRILVNGVPAEQGMKISNFDEIRVDNKLIEKKNPFVYIAFNKPRRIICTTDETVHDNIISFIKYPLRIFPIGRLDRDSEGLIFLTNDGDIVNKILRAGNKHEKEYIVTVDLPITDSFIHGMSSGVRILGKTTKKCFVSKEGKYTFRIILTEGLNRQIRRMCSVFGYEVKRLKRIRIMNVTCDGIKQGTWRNLTETELKEINQAIASSKKTYQ